MGGRSSYISGRVSTVSTAENWLFGVAILIGVVGVVVPVLPGWILVWAAILVWATEIHQPYAWVVLAVASLSIAISQIAKWILPERQLRTAGVKRSSMMTGALLGIVGFFVVPVIGLVIGFVAGVYVAEFSRSASAAHACHSVRQALKSTGVSMLIELAGVLVAAGSWLTAVLAH